MNLREKLLNIQSNLNAPKNQRNNFGKYNYRSCEDILEALKPLLVENKCTMTIDDTPFFSDGWHYIQANVTLLDCESDDNVTCTAFARESESKKGMDESQITGSTSSYARKYALNGMFCIDDNKDADSQDDISKSTSKASKKFICKNCGAEVNGAKKPDGTVLTAEQMYNGCNGLCYNCYKQQGNING